MTDRREDILVRLLAICGALEGVDGRNVSRNLDEIPDNARPAVIIFDGDETAQQRESDSERSHGASALSLVDMTPQIRILLGSTAADVGSDLNLMRARLVKSVTTDAELASIVRRPHRIRYHSAETALGHGRTMDGDMVVRFTITYPLEPTKL